MTSRIEGCCECGRFATSALLPTWGSSLAVASIASMGFPGTDRRRFGTVHLVGPHTTFRVEVDGRTLDHTFCEKCGSKLFYRSSDEPDVTHLIEDAIRTNDALN
jgi:hypothetical protein